MSNTTTKSENVSFLTVEEFKAKLGLNSEKTTIVKSPLTGKLFLSVGTSNFKCQQEIDTTKEMKMLVDNGDLNEACLTNVKESANNVLFTF